MNLKILYRGPLASCNYTCHYCPFAKRQETPAQHRQDAQALTRFVQWVAQQETHHRLGIFFTPWGEALHHRRYQQAFIDLSHMPHVDKVTIQTNLSCSLNWLEQCHKPSVALWTTYHPGEVKRTTFINQVKEVDARGVALSVGIVGLHQHITEIEALRQEIPTHIYVWINAYKRIPDYYTPAQLQHLMTIDPLFHLNTVRHPSHNQACHTGQSVFSVDGQGTMRRCHFIRQPIGNIYQPTWEKALQPRPCSNTTCGCHIGYVHMPKLQLDKIFGHKILERIPLTPIWTHPPKNP